MGFYSPISKEEFCCFFLFCSSSGDRSRCGGQRPGRLPHYKPPRLVFDQWKWQHLHEGASGPGAPQPVWSGSRGVRRGRCSTTDDRDAVHQGHRHQRQQPSLLPAKLRGERSRKQSRGDHRIEAKREYKRARVCLCVYFHNLCFLAFSNAAQALQRHSWHMFDLSRQRFASLWQQQELFKILNALRLKHAEWNTHSLGWDRPYMTAAKES